MGGCVNPSIWFADSWDIEGKVEALKARCGFDSSVNDGVNWAYAGSEMDAQSILLVAGLLLLIGFSGYLIIYNIFYISVAADIHFYGLLKTIGTTRRQLAGIVRRQAYLLCVVGIPGRTFCRIFYRGMAHAVHYEKHDFRERFYDFAEPLGFRGKRGLCFSDCLD